MDTSSLFAIGLFAFVMSATPGPNNIMLLASGAQYGFVRTIPHLFGIVTGVACMNASVLLGLGVLFELYPTLYDVLKIAGSGYLLWLAWKIANASTEDESLNNESDHTEGAPMFMMSAALFQFVNPKAWTMSLSSMSTFTLAGSLYLESGAWIILAYIVMGFIAISLWAGLGVAIRQWLTTTSRRRYFNWFMGLMTAATLILIFA